MASCQFVLLCKLGGESEVTGEHVGLADGSWVGLEGFRDRFFQEGGFEAGAKVSREEADQKLGFDGGEVAEEFGEKSCFLEGAFCFGDGVEELREVFQGEVLSRVGSLAGGIVPRGGGRCGRPRRSTWRVGGRWRGGLSGFQKGLPNDGCSQGEGLALAEEAVGEEVDGVGQKLVVELLEVVGDEGLFS